MNNIFKPVPPSHTFNRLGRWDRNKKVLSEPLAIRVTRSPGVALDTENFKGVAVFFPPRRKS